MSKKHYSIRKVNNFIADEFDIGKYVKFIGNYNIDNFLLFTLAPIALQEQRGLGIYFI